MSEEASPESPEPSAPLSVPLLLFIAALVAGPPLVMLGYLGGLKLLAQAMMGVGGGMFAAGYIWLQTVRPRRRHWSTLLWAAGEDPSPRPIPPLAILLMITGAPLFVMGLMFLQDLTRK
jgi:hypothetical protein